MRMAWVVLSTGDGDARLENEIQGLGEIEPWVFEDSATKGGIK
jgi:hypothetical protein